MKTQLSVLELEQRQMLSASVSLANGLLSVVADNKGDYIIVQQPAPQTVEVLIASEAGKTYDFPTAQVKGIAFQGGAGKLGDYFANLTSLPSTQQAGDNPGTNYLQGGTGNDTLIASPNKRALNYLTDPAGSNTIQGGTGFTNIFLGSGTENITLDKGYTALYSILAKNTITGDRHGEGYLIVNNGSVITNADGYQIVTFFQPGISGSAPGKPDGPTVALQPDANGNGILYLNAADGQTATSFTVNQTGDDKSGQLVITYTDPTNGTKTFTVDRDAVSWIASFGPSGSNNTIIDNSDANDVLYGGLQNGNHTLVGGTGAVSVLKGHSGVNTITARAEYDDITAGAGTDTITDMRRTKDAPEGPGAIGDIFRVNPRSTITGFQAGDVVTGIPKSINGTTDNDADQAIDNADYLFWFAFLRSRQSI